MRHVGVMGDPRAVSLRVAGAISDVGESTECDSRYWSLVRG